MLRPRHLVAAFVFAMFSGTLWVSPAANAQMLEPIETFDPSVAFDAVGFIENTGQWNPEAEFLVRTQDTHVWFTRNRMVFESQVLDPVAELDDDVTTEPTGRGFVTGLKYIGGRATLEGTDALPGVHHWIRGAGGRSASGAVGFGEITYRDLYDGIDLTVRPAQGRNGGILKTVYVVDPGADPSQILYEYEGALSVRGVGRTQTEDGRVWMESVVVETEIGDFRETAPAIYQRTEDGTWVNIEGGFRVEDGLITFALGEYDDRFPLYIDPIIVYSRTIGGSGDADYVYQIRADATGIYAVGTTETTDFPTTMGAFDTTAGGAEDGFAAKFDATTGDPIWVTYIGGDDFDRLTDFIVDNGEIVATGYADADGSVQYPTTSGAYQDGPVKDNFHPVLTRFSASGSSLVWSTFVASTQYDDGSDDDDYGLSVTQSASGTYYIAGNTEADGGWPTGTGLFDSDPDGSLSGGGNDNGFVAHVSADGSSLVDFTYLGGDNDDTAYDVELDASGNVVVVSSSESTDMPSTPGVFQPSRNGSQGTSDDDIFLIKLDAGLDSQVWGTYYGGSDSDEGTQDGTYSAFSDDRAVWHGLALDASDRPVIGGTTFSDDLPTTPGSAIPAYPGGGGAAYAAVFSADVTSLDAATYLGGSADDTFGGPVELDAEGNVYLAGQTRNDSDFPIVAAFQPQYGGSGFGDGFTTIFNPDLSGLVCSSYLGGSDSERVLGIVAGPTPREARYGGQTNSPDFPTIGGAIGAPPEGFPNGAGFITATSCAGSSLAIVEDSRQIEPEFGACFASGSFFTYGFSIINDSDSLQGDLGGPELEATIDQAIIVDCQASSGDCVASKAGIEWNGSVEAGATVDFLIRARILGGLPSGVDVCLDGQLNFDAEALGANTSSSMFELCTTTDCAATVDPNRQLGGQVHLPILDFQGQDDVCETWIEIQNLGCEPAKAALVTWGEPGFCPPQAAGPLKVECTGLLKPGSTWNLIGAQVPSGSKSGIVFKFTTLQLTDLGLDLGFDDVTADFLCESLFFGVVGDHDDYRRFKKAYNEGLEFAGVPLDVARGDGTLAADVHRTCPGNETPTAAVTSKYNGISGTHLGTYDEVFGGFGYYAPIVYADSANFSSVLYIHNGGIECSSVELWFKGKDDCLRSTICEILTLAPGETFQFDANDCVGPDFQGNAWLRSSQPLGLVVDIIGRDVLMTYNGEPAEINYTFDPSKSVTRDGNQVAFGPLIYSEYQGWDSGIQVQNLSGVTAAKVKVYFLDRSGDIVTTLVDWICPRGSQTFFLPVIAELPGNWVGSVRVESQEWFSPSQPLVLPPNIVGVATLLKYNDAARTDTIEAIAYNLLPEHKVYDWQLGSGGGSLDSGVGLIAIPSLLRDTEGTGMTSELAIANVVPKPGFTDLAIFLYDQNGLIDYVCQKLNEKQVEYIDLQTWGYLNAGFKGSAIISAFFWEHDVFDNDFFLRNLVGLAAVAVERKDTRLGEDIPGDESAGARGIPFRQDDIDDNGDEFCFMGFVPLCPGFADTRPDPFECPEEATFSCTNCPQPISNAMTAVGVVEANILNQNCRVTDVDVNLDVTHTWYGDLFVSLTHADVNGSELFGDICGDFEDMDVTLDDDAAAPIGSVCASPLLGTFTTESGDALDAFDGEPAGGRWRLDIFDDFPTDDGMLNDWSITIQTIEQ